MGLTNQAFSQKLAEQEPTGVYNLLGRIKGSSMLVIMFDVNGI